ncbi:hypothetical protein RCO28_00570 [Streptomyces sp. LHD-70]|uniref:SCO2583 family membrane protein n=1 Tax=Streptomyces sp. LHD-70 TaxID=3072140 RepID=UPI00280F624C|nr:hypothetical protein [Streptomyces sp. LHD-70]MDQ8700985.1 hypothetical protein [Streptomyces sp. LHD-70]
MAGPGDPPEGTPEGTPEGVPGGGEEEYRSVVFDESFVRAARLQEFSARERVGEHAPAVRRRPAAAATGSGSLSRQALILVLLIAVAFATAIFMGVRNPAPPPRHRPADPLRTTVVPLAPRGPVPGAQDVSELLSRSPAKQFKAGAAGIGLPAEQRTEHFSDSQVLTALTTAKDYLVASSLDPDALTGGEVRSVRILLDPDQLDQFDRSFERPAADGRHAATGWLVRFDPARTELADPRVRVQGRMRATEVNSELIDVTSEHTFVYAVRPVGGDDERASLFTVRRELHFRFDREDLQRQRTELLASHVQAGPLSCSTGSADRLRPLHAGETAKPGGPAGTDPYASGAQDAALCGTLAGSAQPSPRP